MAKRETYRNLLRNLAQPTGQAPAAQAASPMGENKGLRVEFLRPASNPVDHHGCVSSQYTHGVVTAMVRVDGTDIDFQQVPTSWRLHAPGEQVGVEMWLFCRFVGGYDVWALVPAPERMPATPQEAYRHCNDGWAAGGNYASLGDSRFRQFVEFYGAPAVHDLRLWPLARVEEGPMLAICNDGRREAVPVQASPEQQAYVAELVRRVEGCGESCRCPSH